MRILLFNLLLFLLPFILYAGYIAIKNRSLAVGGDWDEKKIAILSAIGLAFMMAGLAIWKAQDSSDNSRNPLLEFEEPEYKPEPEPERPSFGGPF